MKGEGHINGGSRVVFIFHFGFGQSRFVARTPINRLFTAVHIAAFFQVPETVDDGLLIGRRHGQIRTLPVSQDAHALKFLALDIDKLIRKGFGLLAKRGAVDFMLVGHFELFHQLQLNRQPMAIPTGNVRRIIARHGLRTDDDILENLVKRVA